MTRKTKKQKMYRSERKQSLSSTSNLTPPERPSILIKNLTLTKEEELTNTYFKADFRKSFFIISAIIIAEVVLYYTNFANRLLGK